MPLIRIAVTAFLFGAVLYVVNLAEMLDTIASTQPAAWLLALLLFATQVDLSATRWALAIEALAGRQPHHRLLVYTYMGQFAGLFLLASVGGAAVKAWMAHRDGVPAADAISSVVIDRFLAMASLLVLAVVATPFLMISVIEANAVRDLAAVSVPLALAGLALSAIVWRFRVLESALEWPYLGPVLRYLLDVLRQTARMRFLALGIGVSVLCQLTMIVTVFVLARGAGIRLDLIDCFLVLPPVMLVAALPISIAGWGVREGAMVVGLGLVGVAQEHALALSIQFGAVGVLVGLVGGLAWFRMISAADLSKMRKFPRR